MSIFLNKRINVRLHLITGPMFSGKTTKLIKYVDDYFSSSPLYESQDKVIIYKYFLDDRYSTTKISTHDKVMRPAISCKSLVPHLKECDDKEIVAFDEGQFFDDLYEFIHLLIKTRNSTENTANSIPLDIIVDSLDGDFLHHPFGQALDLLPICDSFTKLRATLKLDNENSTEQDSLFKIKGASFSLRTIKSSKLKLIGGGEAYKASTREEYIKQSQAFISSEYKEEKKEFPHSIKYGFVSIFIGREKSGKTNQLIKKISEIENYNSTNSENDKKTIIFISSENESISQNSLKCKTSAVL